MWEAN